jgi:hypothetical protein
MTVSLMWRAALWPCWRCPAIGGLQLRTQGRERCRQRREIVQRGPRRHGLGQLRACHQDARARGGPGRRHAAGPAGAAGHGLPALAQTARRPGADHGRALHQAQPVEPGAGLRAVPARRDQLQRQPGPAGQRWPGRTCPNATSARRATPGRPSSSWSSSSRTRATRPMRGCAWTTSSTRWRPTKCTWRATTSAAAPTWPRPTAPSRRWPSSSRRRPSKRRCTSWCKATTSWSCPLRDAAERVLRTELPQQRFLTNGLAAKRTGKPWWQLLVGAAQRRRLQCPASQLASQSSASARRPAAHRRQGRQQARP